MSEDNTPKELYSVFELDGVEYKTLLTSKFRNRKKYIQKHPKNIIAQIPGTIIKVLTRRGRRVEMGDNLIMIEAMKMQSFVQATAPGKVKKIHVKKGQMVSKGYLMIEID